MTVARPIEGCFNDLIFTVGGPVVQTRPLQARCLWQSSHAGSFGAVATEDPALSVNRSCFFGVSLPRQHCTERSVQCNLRTKEMNMTSCQQGLFNRDRDDIVVGDMVIPRVGM